MKLEWQRGGDGFATDLDLLLDGRLYGWVRWYPGSARLYAKVRPALGGEEVRFDSLRPAMRWLKERSVIDIISGRIPRNPEEWR